MSIYKFHIFQLIQNIMFNYYLQIFHWLVQAPGYDIHNNKQHSIAA